MFKHVCKYIFNKPNNILKNFSTVTVQSDLIKKSSNKDLDYLDENNFVNDENKSVLVPHTNEDLSNIDTYLKPTFNFAAYINKSDTLQQLLKLGVNFQKLEKDVEAPPFILKLKFDDIKEHIIFLRELGLENDKIGELITRNPYIFKEDRDNLQVRINYLKYKKFSDEMIQRIIERNPFWLSHSTQYIDEKLGFFQKKFNLTGDEVRYLAAKRPKLITHEESKIRINMFVVKEEMGFTEEQMKKMLLDTPKIYSKSQYNIIRTFEYLHKTMGISLERLAETPSILTWRKRRLMERHMFLDKLGRAQYDPKKPNYVSLFALVTGDDATFATEIAKSSVHAYNAFLKTL